MVDCQAYIGFGFEVLGHELLTGKGRLPFVPARDGLLN